METKPAQKNRFWLWVLWALGVRTPASDAEYGKALARYRSWSSIPVLVMSLAVFALIALKITLVMSAFISAFNSQDLEAVVGSYELSTPVEQIILLTMLDLVQQAAHAFPLYLHIPLIVLWLLAFVVDFIVAATLAENKALWWKRHWGGIITALITIP